MICSSSDLFSGLSAAQLRTEMLGLVNGGGCRSVVKVRSQDDETFTSQPIAEIFEEIGQPPPGVQNEHTRAYSPYWRC